ncbi:MAG: hypothetical protein ABIK92_21765 [Pseudomonadota bacterium]
MTLIPYSISNFAGVDATSDPFILGRKNPEAVSLSYNYRARKGGIRTVRGGYREVVTGTSFNRSGLYFPKNSEVTIPYVALGTAYNTCGMMALDKVDFTIEFWYKCNFRGQEYEIASNPYMRNSTGAYKHMRVAFYPVVESGSTLRITGVQVEFLTHDGTAGGSAATVTANVYYYETIPTDGEWHHIAIARDTDGGMWLSIDDDTSYSAMTKNTGPASDNESLIKSAHVANIGTAFGGNGNVNSYPLFGACYQLGLDNGALAEWRMWGDYRSISEILNNKDVVLSSTGNDLKFYLPLDEAEGKRPQERVSGVYGYFSPMEPYVNDDYELVFNGWDSIAIPSTVGGFTTPLSSTTARCNNGYELNEDGSVHGGILWDRALYSVDAGTDPDYTKIASGEDAYRAEGMGTYKGTAQLRIRLNQLGEGVIAGRLGVKWDHTLSNFVLYFADMTHNATTSKTARLYYTSDSVGYVNASWIGSGNEKTITVIYDGTKALANRVKIFVDDSEATVSNAAVGYWNDTDTTGYPMTTLGDTYPAFVENWTDAFIGVTGAIGGMPSNPNMGVAFDLLFFRQWWDDHPYAESGADSDADNQNLVDATYNVNKLPDRERLFLDRANTDDQDPMGGAAALKSCWISDLSGYDFSAYKKRVFVVCPSLSFPDSEEGSFTAGTSALLLGNKYIVKRGIQWDYGYGAYAASEKRVLLFPQSYVGFSKKYIGYLWRSGFLLSNLVNDLNSDTFKYNFQERIIFTDGNGSSATGGDYDFRYRDQRLVGTFIDDSPVQGSEDIGGISYKTRYFELNGGGSTTKSGHSVYKLRSLSPRWCSGPLSFAANFPYIQAIVRYKTEKEDVNHLFVVANSQIWEVNTSTGVCTQREKGWIKSGLTNAVNFSIVNNRGVFLSLDDAIKITPKDKFAFLGVERPTQISFTDIPEVLVSEIAGFSDSDAVINHENRIAYTLQYSDMGNGAFSGTMPIFKDSNFMVYLDTQLSPQIGAPEVELQTYGTADPDARNLLLYKTKDLEGIGVESLLYKASDQIMPDGFEAVRVYDRMLYTQMTDQSLLPLSHYGQDLVPRPGAAMEVAYGRLFMFNVDELASALTWSDVDSLGLAIPDQFPELNALIIEEGGTTSGKALQRFNGILYAFKDNSIFRINPESGGTFSSQLIYKGVGALNQRCVLVAGDAMLFMDTNGIYSYTQGEPQLVTTGLADFFANNVNQTTLSSKAFMLHSKKDDLVLAFVPSSSSSYCDRCVVIDLRTGVISIDAVPYVTCGYVDGETIYVGTPYGKILKYDPDTYVDVADSALTGTGSVSGATVTGGLSLPVDGSNIGAVVYIADTTNHRVWSGTITSEISTSSFSVDSWKAIFNATGETPSGTITYYIGHILVYEKTPIFNFQGNLGESTMYNKNLKEVEWLSTGFSSISGMMTKHDYDNGVTDPTASHSPSGQEYRYPVLQGMHKGFSMESVFFASSAFSMRNVTYNIEHTKGKLHG